LQLQRIQQKTLYVVIHEMTSCVRSLGPDVECTDAVAREFAGARNVERLHAHIIKGVYDGSGGELRIGRQSDLELQSIMRSVYANEARHLPGDVTGQVMRLNASVLNYAVPQIISEARMHAYYMRDREQEQRNPFPRFADVPETQERREMAAPPRPFFIPDA